MLPMTLQGWFYHPMHAFILLTPASPSSPHLAEALRLQAEAGLSLICRSLVSIPLLGSAHITDTVPIQQPVPHPVALITLNVYSILNCLLVKQCIHMTQNPKDTTRDAEGNVLLLLPVSPQWVQPPGAQGCGFITPNGDDLFICLPCFRNWACLVNCFIPRVWHSAWHIVEVLCM